MITTNQPTLILLDCHPDSQASCIADPNDPPDIPPCPLWSCFVEATLEYCRIASITPSSTRIPDALKKGLKSLESCGFNDRIKARIILILMGKPNEKNFDYQETLEQKTIDLRNVICELLEKRKSNNHSTSSKKQKNIDRSIQYHFDILRVVPSFDHFSDDVSRTKIPISRQNTELSATVYNIPPVLGVPMKKSNQTKTSYEIKLYYPAGDHLPHSNSTSTSFPKSKLYEPECMNNRETVVKWQQKVHGLETTVTRCAHIVTPMDISQPTRVMINSLAKGAIYAMIDPSLSIDPANRNEDSLNQGKTILFSHILVYHKEIGSLFLLCQHINHGQNIHPLDVMNIEIPKNFINYPKKIDYSNYISFFEESIIKPNTISKESADINQFLGLVKLPTKLSSDQQMIKSNKNLDIESRWIKAFINFNNDTDTDFKLLTNLSQGSPVFEIIVKLKNLLCAESLKEDFIKIINDILDDLLMIGRTGKAFKDQREANLFLKKITSIAEAFKSKSKKHDEVN
ncbi:5068_t:CDS:10 [Entrophospora sp. SA101]|nr:5068_t:CDS:10 [Entrophospora sp. SA101]